MAKVAFLDDTIEIGFIVYADEDTFDMYIRDNVHNKDVIDEDMSGAIMIEDEEDIKGIDFIFTKATFMTDKIDNITHDISHHFSVEQTPFFDLASQGIYHKYEESKPKRTKKSPKLIKKISGTDSTPKVEGEKELDNEL